MKRTAELKNTFAASAIHSSCCFPPGQGKVGRRFRVMNQSRIVLCLGVFVSLVSLGCASKPAATDENARIESQTRVTKDQIPAEGQRKIPVEEQY